MYEMLKEEAKFQGVLIIAMVLILGGITGCQYNWFKNRDSIDMINVTAAIANMPKVMEILKTHDHEPNVQAAIEKAEADFEDIKQALLDQGNIVTVDFLFSIYDIVKADYNAVYEGVDLKDYSVKDQLALRNFNSGMAVIDKSLMELKAEADNPELKAEEERAVADKILTLLSLVAKIVPAFL